VRLSRRSASNRTCCRRHPPRFEGLPFTRPARAQMGECDTDCRCRRHQISPDFKHFDYVNAQAPKTGSVRMSAVGTFDNFNLAVAASVARSRHTAFGNIYDMLLTRPLDEGGDRLLPARRGGQYPPDFSWVTYRYARRRAGMTASR